MSDDRPRFVSGFRGSGSSYGPPCELAGGTGLKMSCTFGGTQTWAVDDHGNLWNLCIDYRKSISSLTWVMVGAETVRDPNAL